MRKPAFRLIMVLKDTRWPNVWNLYVQGREVFRELFWQKDTVLWVCVGNGNDRRGFAVDDKVYEYLTRNGSSWLEPVEDQELEFEVRQIAVSIIETVRDMK